MSSFHTLVAGLDDNRERRCYERFLLSEPFPSLRSIPGFRDADVLRRLESDEVAFVTLRVGNGNEPERVAALERTERGEVGHGGLGFAAGS